MKAFRRVVCLVGLAFVTSCAGAEPPAPPTDAVTADPAHYAVIAENPAVRILKITYGPGERSIMHTHPDALAVPLVTSTTRFTLPDGTTTDSELLADSALYTPAATHNPENVGSTATDAILVEFKTASPGTATLPALREGLAMTMLAEGPRASAFRTTAGPSFEEPAGTTHEYDQIVIALGAAEMSLSIADQPAKTTWARGDVQFIGRGVPHASKNLAGAPIDFVIVAIK